MNHFEEGQRVRMICYPRAVGTMERDLWGNLAFCRDGSNSYDYSAAKWFELVPGAPQPKSYEYAIKEIATGLYKRHGSSVPGGYLTHSIGPKEQRNLWVHRGIAHACVRAWNQDHGFKKFVVVRVKGS